MVVRVVGSHPVRLVWEYLIPTVLQGKCGMILMGCFFVRNVTLNGTFDVQVMFRKTGYIYGKVYITGWHFMDFPMPQVGDFELMVRGRYEGGDGPVRKIRIQGEIIIMGSILFLLILWLISLNTILICFSGKAAMMEPSLSLLALVLLALCTVGLQT